MAFIDGEPLTCRSVEPEPKGAPSGEASPLASSATSAALDCPADRDIAALVRKVALALDHAHAKGVVHRDLKPGNIMLDRRGEPIVVDFGLARRMEVQDATLTQRGVILGSLAYMSPEQAMAEHEQVGPASDIYSLGVIFYELLTGQLPYRGRRSSVLGQIISGEPVQLTHRSDLDPRLQAICGRALAKRAEERFASMAEFAAALQGYLDRNGETTDVYAAPTPATSKMRLTVVSGVLLLLAMFGVALGGLIVIKLQTKDGTLVVEINEPGAKVTVLNERGEVEIARASDGGTLKLSVDPGKHRLKVEKDGFAVFAKEFSIESGATNSIKATLVPPRPPVSDASVAIPAPPGTKSQTINGWGTVVDPDRDCRFAESDGKLTITVPGTYHDLTHSDDRDQLNSPRVIQEVKGNFVAQVKVQVFPLPAEGTSTSQGICFVSSGLLIWLDGDNFIRMDRAAIAGFPTPGVIVSFYEKGKSTVKLFKEIDDKDANLRITRSSGKIRFEASQDGNTWNLVHSSEIPLPDVVNVGVLAVNTTTKEFAPQLTGLQITK